MIYLCAIYYCGQVMLQHNRNVISYDLVSIKDSNDRAFLVISLAKKVMFSVALV